MFIRDRQTGRTERVSVGRVGEQGDNGSDSPAISPDGRFVAFASASRNLVPGDTNDQVDVFIRDRWTGTTIRSSVTSTDVQNQGDSFNPNAFGRRTFHRLPSES